MKTRFWIIIATSVTFGIFIIIGTTGTIVFEIEDEPEPQSDTTLEKTDSTYDYTTNITCKGNKLCLTEKIVKIVDGDTIYLDGGYKIRLSLTNTPEIHESGFHEATQFTADLCPIGTRAMLDQDDKQPYDVYDRLLGKVVCGNKVLNSELLYAGHANILTRYCSTSEFSDEKWAQEFGC